MRIVNLIKYSISAIVSPICAIKEKIVLLKRDSILWTDMYLEYDIEPDNMRQIIVHKLPEKGIYKIINSGISDNFLYHVVLEICEKDHDAIGIYRLIVKEKKVEKIFQLTIFKDDDYKNFDNFTNRYIWIGDLEDNKLLIRVRPNKVDKYYYKNLDSAFTQELDTKFTAKDMRYYGNVEDEKEEYYVFRTGNYGSVEDRRFGIKCGYEYEYLEDKIIVVAKNDFELNGLNNTDKHINVAIAGKTQGIDTVWIERNCIHYFVENIHDEKFEHYVFDFSKKTKNIMHGEIAGLIPFIDNGKCFYCLEKEDSIFVLNSDGKQVFSLKISDFNERVEEVLGNYLVVGSWGNPFMKRIYNIANGGLLGEYEANSVKYFDKEDILVIT